MVPTELPCIAIMLGLLPLLQCQHTSTSIYMYICMYMHMHAGRSVCCRLRGTNLEGGQERNVITARFPGKLQLHCISFLLLVLRRRPQHKIIKISAYSTLIKFPLRTHEGNDKGLFNRTKSNSVHIPHCTYIYTYQGNDKGFFEAKTTSDGEHRVQAGEDGRKQDDLADAGAHGETGQVAAQRSQLLPARERILQRNTRYLLSAKF